MSTGEDAAGSGPVVFAYDGSTLARAAIAQAGRLLTGGRDALVLTVWQPYDVGFVPADAAQLNAADSAAVRRAAELTAAEGASLAQASRFPARGFAIEATPTWKGIVEFADEHDAGLIVLGSHGRTRILDALLGSVAGAVASHSRRTVMIAHARN
jgi:nucleotide-binding universal stress UspA family protein